MPRVAIYGQVMPVVCHNKRGCRVVNIDQLKAINTSTEGEPYRTVGDYDPISKKWK